MEIRHPYTHELSQLKQIFKTCFGDSDQYIEHFFEGAYQPQQTLVGVENDTVFAMMFMLPARLKVEQTSYPGAYVYAVATLPHYRNRGVMKQLENAAEEYCRTQACLFMTLVPAQRPLFEMYQKLGYRLKFCLAYEKIAVNAYAQTALATQITTPSKVQFIKMRNQYLSHFQVALQLDGKMQEHTYGDLTQFGSAVLEVQNRLGSGYVVCRFFKEQLTIREVGMDNAAFDASLKAIASKFAVREFTLERPVTLPKSGTLTKPYGMIKMLQPGIEWASTIAPYMNLMLD